MAKKSESGGTITRDVELSAINRIVKALNELPARARQRVMAFVGDRLEEQAESLFPAKPVEE